MGFAVPKYLSAILSVSTIDLMSANAVEGSPSRNENVNKLSLQNKITYSNYVKKLRECVYAPFTSLGISNFSS